MLHEYYNNVENVYTQQLHTCSSSGVNDLGMYMCRSSCPDPKGHIIVWHMYLNVWNGPKGALQSKIAVFVVNIS